jgi:hypothetical protein
LWSGNYSPAQVAEMLNGLEGPAWWDKEVVFDHMAEFFNVSNSIFC